MPPAPTRVLVVAEQPLVIWALEETLVGAGIHVTTGTSAEDVRRYLGEGSFDAIVMPCQLGESDTTDMLVEIDRGRPEVRLIALCPAECVEALRRRLVRGRVCEAPFNIDEVIQAILGRGENRGRAAHA